MHDRNKLLLIALRAAPRGVTDQQLRKRLHHFGMLLHWGVYFRLMDTAIGEGHVRQEDVRRLVAGMTVREPKYFLTEAGEAALSALEQAGGVE